MTQEIYNSRAAMDAYACGEYGAVLEMALQHAKDGDSWAQCMISLLYQNGQGVERNLAEAEKWLLLAAQQDNALAWNNLGTLYVIAGNDLPHGEGKTRECYARAKELGFDCAYPYPPE